MPLFINPRVHPKSQWSFISKHMVLQTPMGIGFLAGYLRKQNPDIKIKIVDEHIQPLNYDELKQLISELDTPKLVCISSMTIQIARANELAKWSKEIDSSVKVILGGVHPTVLPEESLTKGYVDVVVRFEGEETLYELYNAYKNNLEITGIKGIAYISKDNTIIHTAKRNPIELSKIPLYPYDLFEDKIEFYNSFGSLSTSRGCPHSCIFCSNRTVTGKIYRHFPVEWICETLDILINKYKRRYIIFVDDILFANKKYLFEITKMIKENNFHKKAVFHGSARADSIDEDIVKTCKEVNFVFLGVGVETSSDRLLKILKKNETVRQIRDAVELISRYDIITTTGLIFGIPTETRKERYDTIKYSLEIPIANTRFNTIVPYPGTELYDIAVKEGRLNKKEDYYNFNVQYYLFGNALPFVPKGTDKFELIFDTMWANIRFYLSLRTLKNIRKNSYVGGVTIHIPKKISISHYFVFAKFATLVSIRFIEIGFIVITRTVLKKMKLIEQS